MKKKITALAVTILTFAALFSCTKTGDKLIMATEAGFAPYEYSEDGTTVIGVDVDIAKEIAKAMGKELEIQNTTFDGALLAVQQGKVDFAAAGISVTEDRKEIMDFTIEYATSKQVIVVNKEAGVVNGVDDIKPETIVGVQMGNVADFYVTEEMDCVVNQYNKFLEAAQDLKNDKIDCIVMDSLPAEEMVKANPELVILEEELFTDKYAIAVQKGNTEMLNAINEVLEALIAEGKIDEFTISHTTK
ncbi:MAG: transporter substrate-binding domain-containing protein [Clostridiales bacterium]|nr:transporter substrate-binding domain-containing protein [Clostridiales bacterium]